MQQLEAEWKELDEEFSFVAECNLGEEFMAPDKVERLDSIAIRIMGFMEKDQHIDTELFRLFLSSGAYLEYAREYLRPDQIDEVDLSGHFKS